MALYDVTATGFFQCRGSGGQFLPKQSFALTYQFELSSPDEEIGDELYALIDQDAPDGCVSISGVSTSRTPSIVGPGVDHGLGDSPPDGRPTGEPGQLVTVYAIVACEDSQTGQILFRTIRVDVLWDATVDAVIAELYAAAEGMTQSSGGDYPCEVISIQVTAPAYFQYLTVA